MNIWHALGMLAQAMESGSTLAAKEAADAIEHELGETDLNDMMEFVEGRYTYHGPKKP